METHLLKIKIIVHKLKLSVKFAATVELSLKIDDQEHILVQNIQAKSVQLALNTEKLIKSQVNFDLKKCQYENKRINFVFYVTSKLNKNRLNGGIANLNLKAFASAYHQKIKIDKCNDPTAFIQYSIEMKFISQSYQLEAYRLHKFESKVQNAQKTMRQNFNSQIYRSDPQLHKGQYQQLVNENSLSLSNKNIDKELKSSGQVLLNRTIQQNMTDQTKTERPSYTRSRVTLRAESGKKIHKDSRLLQDFIDFNQIKLLIKDAEAKKCEVDCLKKQISGHMKKITHLSEMLDAKQLQNSNLHIKLDFREKSTFQEVKTLKNKLKEVENQLKNQIYEKNNILSSIQQRQKSSRIKDQERQRQINLLRKQLQSENNRESIIGVIKEQKQEMKTNILSLTQTIREFKTYIIQLQTEKSTLTVDNQKLKDHLVEIPSLQKKLQEQIEANIKNKQEIKRISISKSKALAENEDLLRLNKHLNTIIEELNQNISAYKVKEEKSDILVKNNKKQLQDLRHSIEHAKIKEAHFLETIKSNETKLLLETQKAQRYSKQIKHLTDQIEKLQQDIKRLKNESANQIKNQKKTNQLNKNKLQYLKRQILGLEKQKDELLVKLQVMKETKQDLELKIIKDNEQIQFLNQLISTLKQQDNYQTNLNRQLQQKQLQAVILEQQLHQLQTQLQYAQKTYYISSIETKNELQYFKQKEEKKNEEIEQMRQFMNQIQKENMELLNEISDINHELDLKNKHIQYLKDQEQRMRGINNNLELDYNQLRKQLQKFQQNQAQLTLQLDQSKKNSKRLESVQSTLKKEFQSYKQNNNNYIKKICQIIKGYDLSISSKVIHVEKEINKQIQDLMIWLKSNRAKLNEKYEASQREKQKYYLKCQQYEAINSQRQNRLQELQFEITKVTNSQVLLESKYNTQLQQLKTFQSNKVALSRQFQLVEQSAKQTEKKLNKQIQLISNTNKQLGLKINNLETSLKEANQRIQINQNESSLKLSQYEKYCNQIINDLNLQKTVLLNQLKDCNHEINIMRNKIAENETKNSKMIEQKQLNSKETQRKTQQLISSKAEINENKKIIKKLQQQIKLLKIIIEKESAKGKSEENKAQDLNIKNDELINLLSDLKKNVKQKENLIFSLKNSITSLQRQKQTALKEVKDLMTVQKNLEEKNLKANQNIKNNRQITLKLQDKLKVLQKEQKFKGENLSKQLQTLFKQKQLIVKNSTQQKNRFQKRLGELTNINNILTQQNNVLKKKNETLNESNAQLKTTVSLMSFEIKEASMQRQKQIERFQQKQSINFPLNQSIKQIKYDLSEFKMLMKQFNEAKMETSKFINLQSVEPKRQYFDQITRQINIIVNRFKVSLLKKLKIEEKEKEQILSQLKSLQLIIDKFSKFSF